MSRPRSGIYDLAGTPSMRSWGSRPLVYCTDEFEWSADLLLPAGIDRQHPDVSPLYASADSLRRMPPALFTIGTGEPGHPPTPTPTPTPTTSPHKCHDGGPCP